MMRKPCPNCKQNDWREHVVLVPVNPNGEFVKGYGHVPVYTSRPAEEFYCKFCNWKEGGNPVIVDSSGKVLGKAGE